MPTQEINFKHLADAAGPDPGTPGLKPSQINDHMLPSGLSAFDYWFLMGYSAATRRMVLSNDGRALINAPLRASVVGDSGSNFGTATAFPFNKSVVLLAGAANVVGATIDVWAAGRLGTKASAPGGVTALQVFVGSAAIYSATVTTALTGGLSGAQWSLRTQATVRTTGASATIQSGGGIALVHNQVATVFASTPQVQDLTADRTIGVVWQWQTADAANTVLMSNLTLKVSHPGATVA